MVRPDDAAAAVVERALSDADYDSVVIGGGLRLAYDSVPVFENIIETIRRLAAGGGQTVFRKLSKD